MTDKTHYRKVFKSDHLGVADLEDYTEAGHNLVFTIRCVKQEIGVKVAGRKIDANIAYFVEKVKPLVVNATNSKTMRELTGSPFVEDWSNTTIQLYIDSTAKLKGEVVGGVRISSKRIANNSPLYEKIKNAASEDALQKIWLEDCKSDSAYLDAVNAKIQEFRTDG
jgi:hypothetical protein